MHKNTIIIFVLCSLTRKILCLIFHIRLVFCKERMEHRVTDKYLATVGAEIVG
jgi:hypothetical protein